MTLARRLARTQTLAQQDSAECALNKLARIFATQIEALNRYRIGGEHRATQHQSESAVSPPTLADQQMPAMAKVIEVEPSKERAKRHAPQMTVHHPRNTAAMLGSWRCGAKTRSGKLCKSPAVHGKKRCRMHGGAPGSGAPKGNKNAVKHGLYTRSAIEERKLLRALLRDSHKFLRDLE